MRRPLEDLGGHCTECRELKAEAHCTEYAEKGKDPGF
jgi:hypothetical protein